MLGDVLFLFDGNMDKTALVWSLVHVKVGYERSFVGIYRDGPAQQAVVCKQSGPGCNFVWQAIDICQE